MMRRNIESWVIKSKADMTCILKWIARMNARTIQLDPLTNLHFLGHPTRANLDILPGFPVKKWGFACLVLPTTDLEISGHI